MIRPIKSYTKISTKFAATPDTSRFGKHAGIDYAAPIGTPVYAPCNGQITLVAYGASGGYQIEMNGNNRLRRFLHLRYGSIKVKVGQSVKQGQQIAESGNTGQVTGPHLHYDVRKLGTKWSASFSNYIDPEKELAEANKPKPTYKMPKVDSVVQLLPEGGKRTVYVKGTNKVKGHITPKDKTYLYTVRFVRNNRIGIYTKSGGSKNSKDYGEVALYYTNGKLIKGWKQI